MTFLNYIRELPRTIETIVPLPPCPAPLSELQFANRLVQLLEVAVGDRAAIIHTAPRPGDVLHSMADISAAKGAFGYEPSVLLEEGLRDYTAWARWELRDGDPK